MIEHRLGDCKASDTSTPSWPFHLAVVTAKGSAEHSLHASMTL